MSCDWDIRCVDCGEELGISDANHQSGLMRAIVRHAPELAALERLGGEDCMDDLDLRLNGHHVPLDGFFTRHAGHHLRPVSEYGQYDEACGAAFDCPRCRAPATCGQQVHADPARHLHGHVVSNTWHWQ